MGRIVDNLLDSGCLVVKLLQGDASIVVVQEVKDGRYEWRNVSGDGVAKGGDIFVVDGLDDFLDEDFFSSRVSE